MAIINYITTIQFDFGALGTLPGECARLGIERPLVITDAGVRRAGLLGKLEATLGAAVAAKVYDGTESNPNERAVSEAVAVFHEGRCDGLIALGGGSSIDLAKGVALIATHGGSLQQYAAIEGGAARIGPSVAPVLAIPTTAGTGSEVGRGAVLILDDGRKVGILSPYLVPRAAVCDPELTFGLPPFLTAATGMDAIAHCIETFLSPVFNPPADGIALDGLERAWRSIRVAVAQPRDAMARRDMMSASMQGALAFQKGLGCVHSLSHALGGIDPRLHHGTLNAIFLPAVIRFNADSPSVRDDRRMERLARAMGIEIACDAGEALAHEVARMSRELGLPRGLGQLDVDPSSYDLIAELAEADHCHKTNPRLATKRDYVAMLKEST
ncbi:iron-containing alcohol dehydrogenase [Ramlibacter sp.]|uniref:iron-containing alcohol dehydrogenase n=1 Tax=Ramlibacter sp. TaxID=1917967 RepID=UPI003D11FB96